MQAKITSLTMLNHDVLELKVEIPGHMTYKPGQWALIWYPKSEQALKRAYSIVEYKELKDSSEFTFAIKLLPDGKWSQQLKWSKVWDILDFGGVFGHFVLQDTSNPKVFIGTGTGLAPLISMAEHTIQANKILYFSVSYEKDLFLLDCINQIPNLEKHIHVSREEVLWCEPWRIDPNLFTYSQDTEFYLCGKPDTIIAFKDILIKKWYTHIYTETY